MALAERRWVDHQRRQHAGVSRVAGPDRPPNGGPRKRSSHMSCMACGRRPNRAALLSSAASCAGRDAGGRRRRSRMPLLCGGTGLYFSSLINGLSPSRQSRQQPADEARGLLQEIGPAALHAGCEQMTPKQPGDCARRASQRLARAWEVWRSSGRGLAAWHAGPGLPSAWRFPCGTARSPPGGTARHRRTRGSPPCWPPVRWPKCRQCSTSGSIRPCRRCGRTGFRNWRPICGAKSRSRRQRAGRS